MNSIQIQFISLTIIIAAVACHEIRANSLHLAVLRHSQRTLLCESLTHKAQNMGTLFKKVFDNSDSDIQLLNVTLTAQNHKTRHAIDSWQLEYL